MFIGQYTHTYAHPHAHIYSRIHTQTSIHISSSDRVYCSATTIQGLYRAPIIHPNVLTNTPLNMKTHTHHWIQNTASLSPLPSFHWSSPCYNTGCCKTTQYNLLLVHVCFISESTLQTIITSVGYIFFYERILCLYNDHFCIILHNNSSKLM